MPTVRWRLAAALLCGVLGRSGVARAEARPPAGPGGSDLPDVTAPGWMDEASVQVQGLADNGVPLVGGGLARRVTPRTCLGARALLPSFGSGAYTGELFYRAYFREAPSSLFLEPDLSVHLVRAGTVWVPSVGFLFGVRAAVTPTISAGGSFGPLVFPAATEPTVGFVRLGPIGVGTRMLASVDFNL